MSPIADAELFLDVADADGTGSQLRPLAGQWLDDLTVHARTAYDRHPGGRAAVATARQRDVFIHAKDAAGNWGPMTLYVLPIDKTNPTIIGTPVDVVGSHVTNRLVDETGNRCSPAERSPSTPATRMVSAGRHLPRSGTVQRSRDGPRSRVASRRSGTT